MKGKHYQLVNPFSEAFLETWDLWKEYKSASHNFKYKSVFSEQAALEQLVTLSKGEEEKAIKIIKQSMRREWQGLFPLHETTTGENGKQSTSKKTGQPNLRTAYVNAINRRYGSGESQGDELDSKAV